jgi:hypothetical protein
MRRLLLVLALAACSSSTTGGSGGGGGTSGSGGGSGGSGGGSSGSGGGMAGNLPDGGFSACGKPGDKGNDAGVGQYCQQISDCPFSAPLCSTLGNSGEPANMQTFYCVETCDPCNDPPPSVCGDHATCICQAPGECGCVPNSCSLLFDAGVATSCDGGP